MSILPQHPCLPVDEKHPEKRASRLGKAREEYKYSYEYPDGVAMVEKVPLHDFFSPKYLARVGELDLKIAANHAGSKASRWFGGDSDHRKLFERITKKVAGLRHSDLRSHFTTVSNEIAETVGKRLADELDDYDRVFGTIELPALVSGFLEPAKADEVFAFQRVAGPNPMEIRQVSELPEKFPLTEELFSRAAVGNDTLAAALAEGRAFLADYPLLDGAPRGTNGGYQKYLWAPIALFVQTRGLAEDSLVPVAIQCEQRPGPDNPIVTPDQGVWWKIARTVVQVADGNMHQGITHLAHTHLILEAVIIASKRQLAETHPISILLSPHYQFTLALNEIAQTNLIAPDGQVDLILGATLEGTLGVVKAGLESYRFDQRNPHKELALRGVDSAETLKVFPYREDALDVWDAVSDWVGSYVELYYAGDASVGADLELQGLADEITTEGRLKGVPTLDSRVALTEFVTLIIFTASAQHAAVNFSQFDHMGFVPNMPGAAYAPLPSRAGKGEATEAHYLKMLPPMDQALRQFNIAYQLSNLRDNFLGDYPLLHFRDRRVHKLRTQFKKSLEEIETTIRERNKSRLLSYPYLMPSLIPGSIHI